MSFGIRILIYSVRTGQLSLTPLFNDVPFFLPRAPGQLDQSVYWRERACLLGRVTLPLFSRL